MQIIKNWTAKRAGGRITVYGFDAKTGDPVRVVGVDQIQGGVPWPVATDKDGRAYGLTAGGAEALFSKD